MTLLAFKSAGLFFRPHETYAKPFVGVGGVFFRPAAGRRGAS